MASNRILICGLPGSGKTTLALELVAKLTAARFTVEHLNADAIRKEADDWDFSMEGRVRQALRMCARAWQSKAEVAIMDFVAPTPELRQMASPTYTIWMNTIQQGRYEDTNKLFVPPDNPETPTSTVVTTFHPDNAKALFFYLIPQLRKFDPTKPTTQLLGRFQPWHDGHQALFEKALEKTGQVAIMVRNTPQDEKNPFDFGRVKLNISQALYPKFPGLYEIFSVPNITHITYGRDVGYKIEQEHLGAAIESISATEIRKKMNHDS